MPATDVQQRGMEFFSQGRYEEAAVQFEEALRKDENSKNWNDWAAAQAAAGHISEARRGFEMALRLDPHNLEAASNLRFLAGQDLSGSSSTPSPAAAQVWHQEALLRYNDGQYGEALVLIELALKSEETSLRWNDFAVMQLTVKNPAAAESGYRRALQLDPQNHLASANLVVLLESLGRDRDATSFLNPANAGLVQKNRVAALLVVARTGDTNTLARHILKYLSRVQVQDPTLTTPLAQALSRSRNSEWLTRQCSNLRGGLPAENRSEFLAAFESLSAFDPRFHSVLGFCHMEQGNYDRALAAFHKVFDLNPADLFAEAMILECEHRRHAMDDTTWDPFAGIEEYLKESFCESPWKHLELGVDNGAYLCCPAWLPMCIGVPSRETPEEIWHSPVAVAVRQAVGEGSFAYCSKIHCPKIAARSLPPRSSARERFPELFASLAEDGSPSTPPAEALPKPSTLVLSYDRTCNLACPQCRSSFHAADSAQQRQMDQDYEQFILTAAQHATVLNLDGSGEVFGSRHSRRILQLMTRNQYPKLKFNIISNGQLFDLRAFETFDLKGRLAHVNISMDAARAETYSVVRRGGDFDRLLRNLEFLDGLRSKAGENFHLQLNFVVSALNFREMPEFVTLAQRFHANSILFTIIRNWGTFGGREFERINVARPTNPQHEEFVRILSSPELLNPIVDMGSIQTYRMRNRTTKQ